MLHPNLGHNNPSITEGRVADDIDKLPAKWILTQQNNEELNECCRDIGNLEYEIRKTDPTLRGPDLVIMTCDCGRRHHRLGLSGPED